jgi:hypothetical protein
MHTDRPRVLAAASKRVTQSSVDIKRFVVDCILTEQRIELGVALYPIIVARQ